MNEYFKSNKFKHILHEYEELCKENSGRFLDSEELADIAEYYHLIGKEEEARVAARATNAKAKNFFIFVSVKLVINLNSS